MSPQQKVPAVIDVDVSVLRDAIRDEYAAVAKVLMAGFTSTRVVH
jgi:hypothetical protein